MQTTSIATVVTQHQTFEAPGQKFKQLVWPSTIFNNKTLAPGDVLVGLQQDAVFYVNGDLSFIKWSSVVESLDTCHPSITRHYILVPLWDRFAWLSATRYDHWIQQALVLNPSDQPKGYIAQIQFALHDHIMHNDNMNLDADGETEDGMILLILII